MIACVSSSSRWLLLLLLPFSVLGTSDSSSPNQPQEIQPGDPEPKASTSPIFISPPAAAEQELSQLFLPVCSPLEVEGLAAAAAAEEAEKEGGVRKQEGQEEEEEVDENGWVKEARRTCHETPVPVGATGKSQLFCAYAQPSFRDGVGISLITTPETFARILAMDVPILRGRGRTTKRNDDDAKEPAPPYHAVPVAGKGVGLCATRPLAAHEAYLARTPAVMVDDGAVQGLGAARLAALLGAAVAALPEGHRAAFLALTTHDDDIDDYQQRVGAIFEKNNFVTPWEGVGEFHSTFTHISRLNHACRPNSDYVFDSDTLTQTVFAARDIDAGEELTVTYQDPFQTHASRQSSLLFHWGFQCTCALCTAPAAAVQESDARIAEIQALWAVLDQYAPPSSSAAAATPAHAERLVQLYRDEGLHARLVEAYYRAAVEYNGRGDAGRAVHFAQQALEAGAVRESGIRPFLDNMRALARDPAAHWTWMFRVPKE